MKNMKKKITKNIKGPRREIGVGFTELIIHFSMHIFLLFVSLIANLLFFIIQKIFFLFLFLDIPSKILSFFSIFIRSQLFGFLIFSFLFSILVVVLNFYLIALYIIKFFLFFLQFFNMLFSSLALLFTFYNFIFDLMLIFFLALPVLYFFHYVTLIPEYWGAVSRGFYPELGKKAPNLGDLKLTDIRQYYARAWPPNTVDNRIYDYQSVMHLDKDDAKSNKFVFSSENDYLKSWTLHTLKITDRVNLFVKDIIFLPVSTFYQMIRDDSVYRFTRTTFIPPGVNDPFNHFDVYNPDYNLRTNFMFQQFHSRILGSNGLFRFQSSPFGNKTEHDSGSYPFLTSSSKPNSQHLYAHQVQPLIHNVSSVPISTFLMSPENMIHNERSFGFPEDADLDKMKGVWRSRFYETQIGRLGIFMVRAWSTFFNVRRLLFKWLYYWGLNSLFVPFVFSFYTYDLFSRKLRYLMYSTFDFFIEFGYFFSAAEEVLDYNFFIYNLDSWFSFSSILNGISFETDSNFTFFFNKFFFHSDNSINVLFFDMNNGLEKSFSSLSISDFIFFNFPIAIFSAFFCFFLFPLSQFFIFFFQEQMLEPLTFSLYMTIDQSSLLSYAYDEYYQARHFFLFIIIFLTWVSYYYLVLSPLFQIDSTEMAIDRDLDKFYSFPMFDDFSLEEDIDYKLDPYNFEDLEEDEEDLEWMLEDLDEEDDNLLVDDEEDFIVNDHHAYSDPLDFGFLTVNDSDRDIVYRSYIKNFLYMTYPTLWVKRVSRQLFHHFFSPLKQVQIGGVKTGDVEFQDEISKPFFDFIEFLGSFKSAHKPEKWVKPMREKREKVPFIELLRSYVSFFKQDNGYSSDVYPGLRIFSSSDTFNRPTSVHLKKEYFSFWFLDLLGQVNIKGLTSSRSFAVFTIEMIFFFYFFSLALSIYFLFISDILYFIAMAIFFVIFFLFIFYFIFLPINYIYIIIIFFLKKWIV